MGGYNRAVTRRPGARRRREVVVAGAWHLHPLFLDASPSACARPSTAPARTCRVFTAHSLPKAVVDREPEYIDQLQATVRAVVGGPACRRPLAVRLPDGRHTPEEWLKPDLKDLLPGLRDAGHRSVLVVPVQFLADHLEVLYDIDVAAREEARRPASPSTASSC